MSKKVLLGKTIAVPETRELERLTALFAEQGATPLAYPLVGIRDTDAVEPVFAWLRDLATGSMNDVIFLTGEGVRRLAGFADRIGILGEFTRALAQARTITRGPKPAAALHELGLRPALPARVPTAEGIMRELEREDMRGRRVGVQLYAEDASADLVRFLADKGASCRLVTPYVYAAASDDARVLDLIERVLAASIDAVAFTSSSQVDRLFQVAETRGYVADLTNALGRIVVAAVGPTCAGTLRRYGVEPNVVPERSFFMRPLVDQLAATLGTSRREEGDNGS
jgi:uroporphyrinogen-III synthase